MAIRTVGRVAFPPVTSGETEEANEARFRAAVDANFSTLNLNDSVLDNRLLSLEESGITGGDGNLDGGKPDSNYGGITAIEGGVP